MKFYSVVIALFVFGFVCQALVEIGGLSAIPVSKASISEAQVTDLQNGMTDAAALGPLFPYQIIVTFIRVIGMGVIAIFSILPLFLQYTGALHISPLVAIPVGMIIQGPLWWVEINGLYQMTSGHTYQSME